jgi:hypothetical protein
VDHGVEIAGSGDPDHKRRSSASAKRQRGRRSEKEVDVRKRLILELENDEMSHVKDVSVVINLVLHDLGCFDGFLVRRDGHGVDEE